tara:strand:- start:63 stop:299 length:237 start_codon:yes stop_codon:yes gene_type:complete
MLLPLLSNDVPGLLLLLPQPLTHLILADGSLPFSLHRCLTWNGHADGGGPGACCELSSGRLQSSLHPTHRASVVRGGA